MTFNDLGNIILKRLQRILNNREMKPSIDTVTLVFDRYDKELSIKATERQRQGKVDSAIIKYHILGNREVPNYRNFLKSRVNKESLAALICEYISQNGSAVLGQGKAIVLAGGLVMGNLSRFFMEAKHQIWKNFIALKKRQIPACYCMLFRPLRTTLVS